MKKIMFNDKYGLTKAVLEGRKTQTRRIARVTDYEADAFNGKFKDNRAGSWGAMTQSRYKVGEIVAVAQSYKFIFDNSQSERAYAEAKLKIWKEHPEFIPEKVFRNKMFVKPEYMPHQIKITNVRLERLQDITDADCMGEGIKEHKFQNVFYFEGDDNNMKENFFTARAAYAALIDKLNGKGTWDENPWVWVYEFELIK